MNNEFPEGGTLIKEFTFKQVAGRHKGKERPTGAGDSITVIGAEVTILRLI